MQKVLVKKQYNKTEAYNLAKGMIKNYVERGDTIQDLKSGQMGCTLGDHDGFGSIGGLWGKQKKRNTDYIVIDFGNKREFVFKLKEIFDDIKSNQLVLF